MRWVACLVPWLAGCSQSEVDRADLNQQAREVPIFDGITVRTEGATVVGDVKPASGSCPPEVEIRAQSFDARVDIEDDRCGPQALLITVTHLPAGELTRTARPFIGALEPRVAAAQEAAGGGVVLGYDIHDPQWTPLAPEAPFETLSSAAGSSPGAVERWTLCTDRSRQAWRLLEGHRPLSACRFATVQAGDTLEPPADDPACDPDGEPPALVDPAAGACVAFDTPNNDPLAQAPLVVRHRLRLEVRPDDCVRFAVWGNNAADADVQRRIIDAVGEAEPLFALITGDLTAAGSRVELGRAALALDGLPVPWYATLGDRDIAGDAAESYPEFIGASTFAFDAGPARVVVLDSASRGFAGADRRALARWLGADNRLWWSTDPPPTRLVFTHIPPFDPVGARGNAFRHRPEAAAFVAALRRGAVPYLFSSQFAIYEEQMVARTRVYHSGGGGAPMELTSGDPRHWLLVTVNDPDCTRQPACLLADQDLCPCIRVDRVDLGAPLPDDLPACRPATVPPLGRF